MEEIWREIRAYPEYQVSNLGNVRTQSGEMLKIYNALPYKRVYLKKPYPRYEYIHRLVALAFIPNPDNKRTVNHIDGNTHNNSIDNLEWATQSENTLHFFQADCFKDKSMKCRRKMSEAHKGKSPWIKGKHFTEEQRNHLSEVHKGIKQSEETCRKRSESLKGHTVSEMARELIGARKRGKVWITNGVEIRMIAPEEYSEYELLGYTKGRKVG